MKGLAIFVVAALAAPAATGDPSKPMWRLARGSTQVEVSGGISRLRGAGWIRSSRAYLDVRIDLQFRIVETGSEGAVVIRGVPGRPGDRPLSGYRVALTATKKGQTPGQVVAISQKLTRATHHPWAETGNEWQHLEVSASGDQVVTILDGQVISTVQGREHQAGYVGFEIARGALEFRRIQVTPIGAVSCPPETDTSLAPPTQIGVVDSTPPPAKAGDVGVQLPKVNREQRPRYTVEAMADKAEGTVWVVAVVETDGSVNNVCVSKSLHQDLDVEAMAAARQWLFKPGLRTGTPVAVAVTIELTFTLR